MPPAILTNWAYSQLNRMAGAPAAYTQTLSHPLAAACINEGLAKATTDPQRLFFRKGADGQLTLRALTSDSYGRLFDADAISATMRLADRAGLELPPVWEGGRGGAYRGERDSFVILTSGGSIVTDPTARSGNGDMFRGLIIRNSEIGASAFEVITFLYRSICGNHLLFGAQLDQQRKRRHVGKFVAHSADQMLRDALRFFTRTESADLAIIDQLISKALGSDKQTVVDKGRAAGLTEQQAADAYTAAEQYKSDPRSVWGYANGITRISQQTEYQNERLELDVLAARLMARHAQLVAA